MFVNPLAMVIGAALISAPIIIHLINRIRFKRVRWAAMEFLLKSQKRSRRKLIIEQLILLLLRILMVLLVGFLLARFMGCSDTGATSEQFTKHIIILDDSPSMGEKSRDATPKDATPLDQAKTLILQKIIREISKAPTGQFVQVLRLSDLEDPKGNFGRLNTGSLQELETYLKGVKPADTHPSMGAGLTKAMELLESESNMKKVVHIVSDFRDVDWSSNGAKNLTEKFEKLKNAETTVYLFDTAFPERVKTELTNTPVYSSNLAITDFRVASRIAIKDVPTECSLTIANYNATDREGIFVRIRVNGKEKLESSVNIARLRRNEETTVRFPITFSESSPKLDGLTGDARKEAELKRFNVITAEIENENEGLDRDNLRYAVVEVQERVPVLIVDNSVTEYEKKGSESFFLWKLLSQTVKGYDVQLKPISEVEKIDLTKYAAVMLCNIPAISEVALKNLEDYVEGGGGLAFFMGPNIKPADIKKYNELIFKQGKGLFPAPLEEKFKNSDLSEKELNELSTAMRLTLTRQLLVRKAMQSHPALSRLYINEDFGNLTYGLAFPQYFVVNRRALVNANVKNTEVLINLPYFGSSLKGSSLDSVETDKRLLTTANALAAKLPIANEQFTRYKEQLTRYKTAIQDAAKNTTTRMPELAFIIEQLIDRDKGDEDNKENPVPNLQIFWQSPEVQELKAEFQALLDEMQYGDAMYLSKTFGKGRVVAYLGSAGSLWNPSDKGYFVPFVRDAVMGYLTGSGTDQNLTLKSPFEFNFDPIHFNPNSRSWIAKEQAPGTSDGAPATGKEVKPVSRGEQILETVEATETKPKSLRLNFKDGSEPGVYFFEFTERRPNAMGALEMISVYKALAYNFDTSEESNLSRTPSKDIADLAKVSQVYNIGSDELSKALSQKKNDFSESPWLYLFMILVLIAEQAMAVRLSFHKRPAEGDVGPAPAKRGVLATA